MDWIKKLNESIEYIENNLDNEISHQELANIMLCSFDNYQKVFSYISGKTLALYIRERRLTQAGIDLLNSNEKIIDIALKYGYSSQDAFTRAFKVFHSCLPNDVRKQHVQLNSTPKISFQIKIIGDISMDHRIEELESFKVLGKSFLFETKNAFLEVPNIWKKVKTDGTLSKLISQMASVNPRGILGIAADGKWGKSEKMNYLVGVSSTKDSFEDFKVLSFPKSKWVVFKVDNKSFVKKTYEYFYSQWLPSSNYQLEELPVIESYAKDGTQEIWFAIKE